MDNNVGFCQKNKIYKSLFVARNMTTLSVAAVKRTVGFQNIFGGFNYNSLKTRVPKKIVFLLILNNIVPLIMMNKTALK